MACCPNLKRWLAAGVVVAIFAATLVFATLPGTLPTQGGDSLKSNEGDWVMYGGTPARNFVNLAARNLPVKWVDDDDEIKKEFVLWSAELGSKAYGGPVVAGDKVIVGTNNQRPRDKAGFNEKGEPIDLGVIMTFDRANGTFLWQSVFKKLAAGQVQDWPKEGICSTPVVEGDRLYYVSNRCELVCSTTGGKIEWKLDMIGKLGVFPHNLATCSPLLIGEYLWLETSNGVDEFHINVPAPKAPSFIKVSKKDGDVVWQNNMPTVKLTEVAQNAEDQKAFFKVLINRGDLIQHGQWSNPAFAEVDGVAQVVFPGGDGWIYSFDLTGKLLWKFDCNPKDAEYHLGGKGTRNDFIATPVIYQNKVYIGVGQDPEHLKGVGHLWCIGMTKRGDVSPELVTDNSVWPPKTKANPNSAMVWHYGGYTTPEDRKKLQRNFYFGRTMSTCAIKDDILYIAELEGYLHCLDANTGKAFWVHDTKAQTWSSTYWADNKVYLGNESGTLFVFAHGKEKKLLAENAMGARVRATPVAAGNVLYVMTENKLWALRNKE